jgi:hypothetical protein
VEAVDVDHQAWPAAPLQPLGQRRGEGRLAAAVDGVQRLEHRSTLTASGFGSAGASGRGP